MSNDHVFVNYDPDVPPSHSGPSYTRFVCISDTHSRVFPVPSGDVLLHAGDLCSWGSVGDLRQTMNWLRSLPHPVKIIIAGNHDLCLDKALKDSFDTTAAQALVRGDSAREAGIIYIEHEAVQITTTHGHTWRVYGSPAAPRYVSGAFQYRTRAEAQNIYNRIPLDTDILLTHTPPYGTHDLTRRGKHAGCKELALKLHDLAESADLLRDRSHQRPDGDAEVVDQADNIIWNCRLHVWGHIHEAHGASIKRERYGEIVQANAALAMGRMPIIVDLRHDN